MEYGFRADIQAQTDEAAWNRTMATLENNITLQTMGDEARADLQTQIDTHETELAQMDIDANAKEALGTSYGTMVQQSMSEMVEILTSDAFATDTDRQIAVDAVLDGLESGWYTLTSLYSLDLEWPEQEVDVSRRTPTYSVGQWVPETYVDGVLVPGHFQE